MRRNFWVVYMHASDSGHGFGGNDVTITGAITGQTMTDLSLNAEKILSEKGYQNPKAVIVNLIPLENSTPSQTPKLDL